MGDSITAGYGLDISQGFPAQIQKKIDLKGWNFKVINAGQSGDTSAGGLTRLDWLMKNRVDVLVLELGANDGLRGLPIDEMKRNLQRIIDRTKERYPQVKIVIAGMQVPPNMGSDYSRRFSAAFTDLAKKNNAALIPFILERVGGLRDLNLPDGIHPTAKGHEIVAEGKDPKNGVELSLVQWMRFRASGYMEMVGIARRDAWAEAFPRMRTLRDGIEYK